MKRSLKRTLDQVIDKHYESGFLAAVYGVELSMATALEYCSTSSWSRFNTARKIAETHGWRDAEKVIANRGRTRFPHAPDAIEPTPECVAECYASVRVLA